MAIARTRYAVLAVAALVVAGGCGTVRSAQPAAHRAGQAVSRPVPTGRPAAQAEASHLLSLLALPPGVSALPSPPASLGGPAVGLPAVSSMVDATRSWRVGLPLEQVMSWLRAHPPRGLRLAGSTRGLQPGVRTAGLAYAEQSSSRAQPPLLEVAAASDNGGSVIRADAVVVWVTGHPFTDVASGRRLRVTVAGGCPRSDAHVVGVANPGAGLTGTLLPAQRPTSALLCRYYGTNGAFALQQSRTVDAATAQRYAAAARAVPLEHPAGGVSSCPLDDGSVGVLAFAYPGRPNVDLWAPVGGCGGLANGHIRSPGGHLTDVTGGSR